MKDNTYNSSSRFNTGTADPIVNISFVEIDGGLALKVTRQSGVCGYVTNKGVSAVQGNSIIVGAERIVTVQTFAQLQAYDFEQNIPANINVINDESKNQQNTSYNWTGTVLKWNAEVVDSYQPTL